MSRPEVLPWQQLRKRPGGFKFCRQLPQAGYKIDFEVRLAIEVDGEAHNRGDRPARDQRRDCVVARHGFETLRISAKAILTDLDSVIAGVVSLCREQGPLHHRSAAGGPPPRSGEEFQEIS